MTPSHTGKTFPTPPCDNVEHAALPPVSRSYSAVQGRSVTHYSPVRHSHPPASWQDPVRLACVKHAASVRPEPESNPPQKNLHGKPKTTLKKKEKRKDGKTRRPDTLQDAGRKESHKLSQTDDQPPHHTGKDSQPSTGNQKQFSSTKHALEFSNHHHTSKQHHSEAMSAVPGNE